MSCLTPPTPGLQNPGVRFCTPAPMAGMYLGDRARAVLRLPARLSGHQSTFAPIANRSYGGFFAHLGPRPLSPAPRTPGPSREATLEVVKLCRTSDLAIWLLAIFSAWRFYYNTLPSFFPHLLLFFFFVVVNSWNYLTPPAPGR